MIKVTCQISNYDEPAKQSIFLHNHWNRKEMIVIEINGEKYTVLAKDLISAITNCTNTAKW